MWHWKKTWEPLQISINRGLQPREKKKRILEDINFLPTSFSNKEAFSSNKEALLKVLKPPSSLCLKSTKNETLLNQAQMFHKSSSTTPWRQIKNTLQNIKSPNLASQYTPNFEFLQSTNLNLISQIKKNTLDRDCTRSYI